MFFLPVFILLELSRRKRLTVPLHAAFLLATTVFWLLKSSVIGRSGVPIHFFPSLWENAGTSLGVLGYYFRSLLFPFQYDMFLPADAVKTLPYLLCGSLFLLLLVAMPWLGRKKPHFLYAWIWIAPFLAGTLLLVFTPIYPFSISTRYLMIPAVGWIWALSHLLGRLPAAVKRSWFFCWFLFRRLAVIGNSKKYRNETAFWKSAPRFLSERQFFPQQVRRPAQSKTAISLAGETTAAPRPHLQNEEFHRRFHCPAAGGDRLRKSPLRRKP